MAKRIEWNGNAIVVAEDHETVTNQCERGDAFVKFQAADGRTPEGWYVTFVGKDGDLSGWDEPFVTADAAVASIQNA